MTLRSAFVPATGTQQPLVSVVMPTLNAASTIGAQLQGLAEQEDGVSWELIVVDGGSTDDTCAQVHEAKTRLAATSVRVIVCAPSRAVQRNMGVQHADGTRILFCDADDRVGPRWIVELTAALDHADIAAGAFVPFIDGDPIPEAEADCPGLVVLGRIERPGVPAWAVGASFGARRQVFTQTGGFRERFDGVEDIELCWRAQMAGATLVSAPKAVVAKRMRRSHRAAFRQHVGYGRASARLRAAYRSHGVPIERGRSLRSWAWLGVNAPRALVGPGRGTWVRVAGDRVGGLRGGLERWRPGG
jgi:GT2 family glycosyltransferase